MNMAAKFLLGLLAIPTFSATCLAQGGPAAVVVAKVTQREFREGHSFVGSIIPARTSDVGSAVDGRVIDYPIFLGKRVKDGDTLAQLLTSQLDIEIKAAEAELVSRQATLAEAQQARAEDIQRAEAMLGAKKAAYDYANAKLNRFKKLAGTNSVTEDQMEEAASMAIQAFQTYNDAIYALDTAKRGARDELKAFARAKVNAQEQEVERLKDLLKKHTIRAPFNGYVVAENTEAGQWVARGGMVAKVIDLDQVDLEIAVLESYVPFIKLNDEATVEITSMADRRFTGKVREINPLGDQRTRNFIVRIRLENNLGPDEIPILKAGMFARATLSVGKPTQALFVPKDAVVLGDPQGAKVFVVAPSPMDPTKQSVMPVYVQLGTAQGDQFEVRGEIAAGTQVVVQGNERLFPGQPVIAKPLEISGK
jgi:RND family efflux transporter MFP subunit